LKGGHCHKLPGLEEHSRERKAFVFSGQGKGQSQFDPFWEMLP